MRIGEKSLNRPAVNPRQWLLDHKVIFLNHGSFGACPKSVLKCQTEWRDRLEHQPLQFLVRELETHLDAAREALAGFVSADPADLVFVTNATTGINIVLRSLILKARDELLVTDHEYNASRNALDFAAKRAGARVIVARLPFPFRTGEDLIAPILNRVTPRTRLALLDHVTSQTGVVLPIQRLVGELQARKIDVLVDGAHGPGMVPLSLDQLGAAYYTGNCHKWMCAPKSVAFLHVRRDRQKIVRPLVISHGANSARKDRSKFALEFGWQGTSDPTAALSVPAAIQFMGAALPGGWPEVMARNRALALTARKILCAALKTPEPCPDQFVGSLASIPLPKKNDIALPRLPFNEYPLQDALREKYHIEVPLIGWPTSRHPLLRISAQLYNALPQYETLGRALVSELPQT